LREQIAITGIGCRFPGDVDGPEEYWQLLVDGVDAVTAVPRQRWDAEAWYDSDDDAPGKTRTRFGSFLSGIDQFDADFFGISGREALQMDPQQRLLLEVAWQALENAGTAPDRLEGSRTGVYVGMGLSDYARRAFLADAENIDAWSGTGTFSSVAAGRIAYALGLSGPALAIHTACSSSLVAVHLAMEALRSGQIDRAIAGGVNLMLSPEPTVYFSKLQAVSRDGRCRTFDASASGYGRGEGCGLVVLERLSTVRDRGDQAVALLAGSMINHDGRSNGLTAPSGRAQQEVLRGALEDAGISATDVSYIEAHGTGTPLGDPIEMDAIKAVYGDGEGTCHVGSAKTNFGHLESAAGIAGLIKAALALRHQAIPKHLHLEALNPRIDLSGTRIEIPTRHTKWEGGAAAVSAFGLAGTNAHIVLQRARDAPPVQRDGRPQLIVLSGHTEEALERAKAVETTGSLADVASTLIHGRAHRAHRVAVLARSLKEARRDLDMTPGRKSHTHGPLAWAFTGQGSQYLGMGHELDEREEVYQQAFDRVDALFHPLLGESLTAIVHGDDEDLLGDTRWTQPALFALQWSLAQLWKSWGIEPDLVLGHSIGEISAACVAGVMSVEDAVILVAERGRLLGSLPRDGSMAAVAASYDRVKSALEGEERVGIAGLNGPAETVISGETSTLLDIVAGLKSRGIDSRMLKVSHAFHSPLVEPVLDAFEAVAKSIELRLPRIPLLSNVTGKMAGPEIATATYWAAHIRKPVRFSSGLEAIPEQSLFLELGPSPILSAMGWRVRPDTHWIPSLRKRVGDRESMLMAVGELYAHGLNPKWDRIVSRRPPVAIAHDAFERKRYWLEPSVTQTGAQPTTESGWVYGETWKPAEPGKRIAGSWGVVGEPKLKKALDGVALKRAENIVIAVKGTDETAWKSGPIALVKALKKYTKARLYLLTTGGVSTAGEPMDPHQSPLWGMGRTLALEHPDRWGGLLDRQPDTDLAVVAGALKTLPEEAAALRGEAFYVPRLTPMPPSEHASIDTAGTWLIAGGTGAIGMQVARWLAEKGVKNIVLTSRKGEAKLDGLAAEVRAVDVANRDGMAALIDAMDPPLTGVVHAAGVAAQAPLFDATPAQLQAPLVSKVAGTAVLDDITRDRNLSAFVVFTSIAGVWGSVGLGAYAAANRFQDSIVTQRRADGLPGLAIAWGPWADGGMVSDAEVETFARMGVKALPSRDALDTLERLLATGGCHVAANVDWATFKPVFSARSPRPFLDDVGSGEVAAPAPSESALALLEGPDRHQRVREAVVAHVSRILGRDEDLDPELGFADAGMDSLMAVELANALSRQLGVEVSTTVAFDYPNLAALTDHLSADAEPDEGAEVSARSDEPIAVVGMGCRFPGAPDPESLWSLLRDGVDAITEVPAERWDMDDWYDPAPGTAGRIASRHGGFLEDIDKFDADFFGISPGEAAALDPQQRLLLEVSWEALERASIPPRSLAGSATAVFVGIGRSEYWDRLHGNPWAGTGNESSFAAGRVAYTLGLRGPALSVNTACSSSLVATHLAVQALRNGECDRALAAGVNLVLSPQGSAYLSQIRALSPTGRCRTFSSKADGYVRSEGCGVLVLRRLSEALEAGDTVLAVIRGTAVGHDGASSGITVPNGPAQQQVIRAAMRDAGVQPGDVAYVECHGTGTPLGDPIEVGAIKETVGQNRRTPLILGSIKTQIGHTETAAGLAGMLKVILAFQYGMIPGNLHLRALSKDLPLDFPVRIPAGLMPWLDGPRIAGVSSFGMSGTNAHVILEAPPEQAVPSIDAPPAILLALSGHTPDAIDDLAMGIEAADVPTAWTLAMGRSHRRYRRPVVAEEIDDLAGETWEALPGQRNIAFLFTGQGSQRPGMGREIHAHFPVFREAIERCAAAFEGDLLGVMFGDGEDIHDTRWTQPALFALEWGLFELYRSWGIEPACVAGHSLGEFVAACAAGVFSVEDGMRLVTARGALMSALPRAGVMAAIGASADDVGVLRIPGVEIAATNGPAETVVSGTRTGVAAFMAAMQGQGFRAKQLTVSHAFHSSQMDGILDPFREVAETVTWHTPRIPVVGNAKGQVIKAFDADYWVRQARNRVDFHSVLNTAATLANTFLELGPRPVLTGMAARALSGDYGFVPTLKGERAGHLEALEGLGRLWATGVDIDWTILYGSRPQQGVVPTTPWQRKRHWIDVAERAVDLEPPALWTWNWEATTIEARPISGTVVGDGVVADSLRISIPEGDDRLIYVAPDGSPVDLTEAVLEHARTAKRLTIVTDPRQASHASLWGLAAVLFAEVPDLHCQIIDTVDASVTALLAAISGPDDRSSVRGSEVLTPVLTAVKPTRGNLAEGSYLVTGGRGALGRHVCEWVAAQGGKPVAMGRSKPTEALGDGVVSVQGDVSNADDVARILDDIDDLKGVFHCAGHASGGLARDVSRTDLEAAFSAKVDGARILHEQTSDLDLFVLFSSATAWFGAPGQAAYAAANAALDGLARERRADGQPAVSIAWGPWRVGMAEQAEWTRDGVEPMSPMRGLAALQSVLDGPANVAVFPVDWARFATRFPRKPAWLQRPDTVDDVALIRMLREAEPETRLNLVEDAFRGVAARLLGKEPGEAGFFDAGMDSLTAVELARQIGVLLGRVISPTVAFDHPDIARLSAHALELLEISTVETASPPEADFQADASAEAVSDAEHDLEPEITRGDAPGPDAIAVVGMACRYPGADNPEALWALMRDGEVPIREVPADRWDIDAWYDPDGGPGKMYAREAGFIDDIDQFDPAFFGIAPREASSIDPQQRLLLEVAWEALDSSKKEERTGVFVGIAERGYLRRFSEAGEPYYPDAWSGTGTEASFAAGRVSHTLGLRGPAISLNTTCSSSLVSVHLAARSLRDRECDAALAGGVHLILDPDDTVYLCQLGALSADSRCHTFDARANGYVRGEGCGMLVLKRLSDAEEAGDPILGIIRGSAVNHDGHSAGLTVPNGTAQQEVLRAALADADIPSESIGYLEAHGTGTPLGDPIEMGAASAVYGDLLLGTVKTHIGHCELAAGVAGLIRTLLILRHGEVPAHPDLQDLNADLPANGLTIPTALTPWVDTPRRAGVSAFGLSGTNAHILLEQAPASDVLPPREGLRLLAITAHSEAAVRALAVVTPRDGATARENNARVRDLPFRAGVVGEAPIRPVQRSRRPPVVAFLFTGQGAQYAGMAQELYASETVFRDTFDRCAAAIDRDLLALLDDDEALVQTKNTQPVIGAIGLSTAALWRSWGVEPAAVAGHSVGEIAAAAFAGCMSIEDAMTMLATRGLLMNDLPSGGAMAAVLAAADVVEPLLVDGVAIAGINHPEETVISGAADAVDAVLTTLPEGTESRLLKVSHAFHSERMDRMLDALEITAETVSLTDPTTPWISALTGAEVTSTDPAFWRRHAREPVRFMDAIRALRERGCDTFIEVGPQPVLLGMGQRTIEDPELTWLASLKRGVDAREQMLSALGAYWAHGGEIDWEVIDGPRSGVVPLPSYPFERERFWLDNDKYQRPSNTWAVRWEAIEPGSEDLPETIAILGEHELRDDLESALAEAGCTVSEEATAILDLRPLGSGDPDSLCAEVVATGQACDRYWVLTRNAQLSSSNPTAAAVWGIARCLYAENPNTRGAAIDIGHIADPSAIVAAMRTREDGLALRRDGLQAQRLTSHAAAAASPTIQGRWLVTGGLGSLGRHVASWLADNGVTSLTLTGRTGLPDDPEHEKSVAVAALRARGIEVHVVAVDVTDRDGMEAVVEGSLNGVVHLAGTTAPQAFADIDPETLKATLAPKLHGAALLDELTADKDLDAFVMFGSVAAVWGSRDLAAYAAGNAFLGALARDRRTRGLPALTLHWGPWGGGGMVDEDRRIRLEKMGLAALDPALALRTMGALMGGDDAEVTVAQIRWRTFLGLVEAIEPRPFFNGVRPASPKATPAPRPAVPTPTRRRSEAEIEQIISSLARETLRLSADTELDRETQLMEHGFDSLMATELRNTLLAAGIDVPLGRLLGGPSVEELVIMATARMAPEESPAPTALQEDTGDVPSFLIWSHVAAGVVGAAITAGLWFLLQRIVLP